MLENGNDFMSFFVLIFGVLYGLYLLFIMFDKNHHLNMKNLRERYYDLYESMTDDYDDEHDIYYE